MRVVFIGSPEFALPSLQRLIDSEHEIVAVFTQPDRPVGRGQKLSPPPVKTLAIEHGLDVHQPKSISRPEVVDQLRRMSPDIGVIAAYGQILKQLVLDVPRLGVLNVHASLLPRWRGAAPIPAAILAGDEYSGATIMQVQLALDSGPMLDRVRIAIRAEDTAGTLTQRIAIAGAELLIDVLPRVEAGQITAEAQDDSAATYAPQLEKSDALIDWKRESADDVWRKVRAYHPWPIAYSYLGGKPLRVLACIPLAQAPRKDEPGTIFAFTGANAATAPSIGFCVVTANGDLGVITVQGPGGKAMPASAYLLGHRDIVGKRLTAAP